MDPVIEAGKRFAARDVPGMRQVLDQAQEEGLDRHAWFTIARWLADDVALYAALSQAALPMSPFGSFVAVQSVPHRHVAVTMVRNEEDTIGSWVRHNQTLGFRRFVLVDHRSTDATVGEARTAASEHDSELVVIREESPEYLQSEMTTAACLYATARWPDATWVFPLDADEFVAARGDLGALLDQCDADCLRLFMVNQVSEIAIRSGMDVDPRTTLVDALRHSVPGNMYKIAVASQALTRGLRLTQGNHFLTGGDYSTASGMLLGAVLRHIANRDLPRFVGKVESAVAAGYADPTTKRRGGGHWAMWATMLLEKGQAELAGSWARRQGALLATSSPEPEATVDTFAASTGGAVDESVTRTV